VIVAKHRRNDRFLEDVFNTCLKLGRSSVFFYLLYFCQDREHIGCVFVTANRTSSSQTSLSRSRYWLYGQMRQLNTFTIPDTWYSFRYENVIFLYPVYGTGSSVGIATELRAGRSGIEFRLGRDFPPVQTDPGAHPASCKIGTGPFPGLKCGRGVLLTTHPLLVPRLWKRRAYTSTHPLGYTGPVTGTLYLLPTQYITT
jgi:hypothetical protein